jgi:hypothetical protein
MLEVGDQKPGKGKLVFGKPRAIHEPAFLTFEAAEACRFLCTKCRPTKSGTKGCRACMGDWFEQFAVGQATMGQVSMLEVLRWLEVSI